MSQSTTPQSTTPQSTTPQSTTTQSTTPQSTTPQATTTQSTTPQSTTTQSTTPQSTTPQSTIPQSTITQSTTPQSTIPQSTPPQSVSVPSTAYQVCVLIGVLFVCLDMASDLVTGINNICSFSTNVERGVQGILSILIIFFPEVVNKISDMLKYHIMIPLEDIADDAGLGEKLYRDVLRHYPWIGSGASPLVSNVFAPVIWGWRHFVQTGKYRENAEDKVSKERFYAAKLMAHLSLKNEAQLEASYQTGLQLYMYLKFHQEYSWIATTILVFSVIFSAISMARAACSDLVKTQHKFYEKDYPEQNKLWKISRLVSRVFQTICTAIANITFIMFIESFFVNHIHISIRITYTLLTCFFINLIFQSVWERIDDKDRFVRGFMFRNGCGFTFSTIVHRWFHFMVRSPFINIYYSASLHHFFQSWKDFACALATNSLSLVLLFYMPALKFWVDADDSIDSGYDLSLYVKCSYVFISSLIMYIVCTIVAKANMKNNTDQWNKYGSRMYKIP